MNLRQLYDAAIKTAMANDPRGAEAARRDLAQARKRFDALKDKDKPYFDQETLANPYADSRILHGGADTEIRSLLVGIDASPAEVLLADRLREKGRPVDALLGHHPEGHALAGMAGVMSLQTGVLAGLGVGIHVAESLMAERIREVEHRLLPANHAQTTDAARLLDVPFLCLHTAADNMVATFLARVFEEKKPDTLDDIVDLLLEQPEYRDARKNNAGPTIFLGDGSRRAGKVFVDMTGGTSGSKDIYASLTASGVSTIVGMHISDEHEKKAKEHHLNVIIAGHISSDNLGLNLLLDAVLPREVTVAECSGFRRFPRGAVPLAQTSPRRRPSRA